MSADSSTTKFFLHGNARQFDYVLKLYPQLLKMKAEEKKKPEELIKLDEWCVWKPRNGKRSDSTRKRENFSVTFCFAFVWFRVRKHVEALRSTIFVYLEKQIAWNALGKAAKSDRSERKFGWKVFFLCTHTAKNVDRSWVWAYFSPGVWVLPTVLFRCVREASREKHF